MSMRCSLQEYFKAATEFFTIQGGDDPSVQAKELLNKHQGKVEEAMEELVHA